MKRQKERPAAFMEVDTYTSHSAKAPVVYEYHDYRAYLKDHFNFRKSRERDFSTRAFAKSVGLTPPYFTMVLNGRRSLSSTTIEKILPALELTPAEQSYFKLLCVIADSSSQEERVQALNKLQNFSTYRKNNPEEFEVYRYLTKWFYVAIKELAATKEFKPDPAWIQNQLAYKVAPAEIRRALEFLEEQKFIKVKPDGSAEVVRKTLSCKDGVFQLALREFHQQMLRLAGEAMTSVHHSRRSILGETLCVSERDFEKIHEILERSARELIALEKTAAGPDAVYHVTLAAFPLTKTRRTENENV
ncbi:MAG TPA: TIGR02147 family protein [Bdellovibrionales bacterium]|nr:TIGR02147 family protein [Bdellovibrionales bacterium]